MARPSPHLKIEDAIPSSRGEREPGRRAVPTHDEALFYRLGDDGRHHLGPLDVDGFYDSAVLPGFRLRVGWLWQRPLPPVDEVVRQIQA